MRQDNANERYHNTVKDLVLRPNAVSQKDEKPHTAGLDDTAIPHVKINGIEIRMKKSQSIYRNTVNFNVPLVCIM